MSTKQSSNSSLANKPREIAMAEINELIAPKIKRIEQLSSADKKATLDKTPMNDTDYAEYLGLLANPKTPNSLGLNHNIVGMVDYTRSVDWNLRGYNRHEQERLKENQRECQRLIDAGYNNSKELDQFRYLVIDTFVQLLFSIYKVKPMMISTLALSLPIKISDTETISLDMFLYRTTITDIHNNDYLIYSPKYLKRAVRRIIYMHGTDSPIMPNDDI